MTRENAPGVTQLDQVEHTCGVKTLTITWTAYMLFPTHEVLGGDISPARARVRFGTALNIDGLNARVLDRSLQPDSLLSRSELAWAPSRAAS